MNDPRIQFGLQKTRRHFFRDCQLGIGAMALSSMLADETIAATAPAPLAQRESHFAAKAKSVIFLHMAGSPPHLDLFDYKPELVKRNGQPCPAEFLKGKRFAFTRGVPKLLGTPREFKQHGRAGAWFSDCLLYTSPSPRDGLLSRMPSSA